MACKREATEADIIDSSVVDVNLLLGLKRKPVSQQNVVKIKAMFAAERKEKKKEKHVPRNPYVTINNIHHTVSMYDNVGTIIDGISSSLSEKMEGTCRKELRDLKRVSNVMTVMAENSKKAMSTLSDEASRTAYKRLKALEEEEEELRDDMEEVELARQKCNKYISDNSKILAEKQKMKRKAKFRSVKKKPCQSERIIEESENLLFLLKDGSKVQLPRPSKGKMYKPIEIWSLIADKVKKKHVRSILLLLIEGRKIPCQLRNAYNRLNDYLCGKEVKSKWNSRGPNSFLDKKDIVSIREEICDAGGEAFNIKSIKNKVQDRVDQKMVKKGIMPSNITKKFLSKRALRIYYNMIACDEKLGVSSNPTKKTIARAQAEKSLRSTMSFILTVALTSFIVGKAPKNHPALKRTGTEGSQVLRDLVSSCYGNNAVYPILPSLLTSTDDTTLFVHKHKKDKERKDGKTYIAPVNHEKKFKNLFETSTEGKKTEGMRVRLTTTISGSGQVSAIYVTIKGLTQKEIPIREGDEASKAGIIIKEIPGLCLSRVFDRNAKTKGYVVFMRGDSNDSISTSVKNFKHYHESVYTDFVESARKSACERYKIAEEVNNIDELEVTPECLTSVGWLDGAVDQLAAVCQPYISSECLKKLMLKCKQSAARTGSEQSSDIGDPYKVLKYEEETTSIDDIPEDTLTEMLESLFSEWSKSNEINLGRKQSIFIDFLARLPHMMTKAFTPEKVRSSFIRNGMLDVESCFWPDLFGMIQTKRGEIKDSELDLIITNFPKLFALMQKLGNIPESVYDELGFPPDFEEDEVGVDRHVGIEREHMQRAKSLTHPEQIKIRDKYKKERENKKNKQEEKAAEKEQKAAQDIYDGNRQCEMKLIEVMTKHNEKISKKKKKKEKDVLYNVGIKFADLKCFSSCSAAELKAFIHARKFTSLNISPSSGWEWPLRGSLAESTSLMKDAGEKDNLMTLAFKLRNEKVIYEYKCAVKD